VDLKLNMNFKRNLEWRTSLKIGQNMDVSFSLQHKHENTFSLGEARLCKKEKKGEKNNNNNRRKQCEFVN
jgi:hypothetical protein